MTKFITDRVKKTPSDKVSEDRYKFLKLSEAEPDLGLPSANNQILYSTLDGTRYWGDEEGVFTNFSLSGHGTSDDPLQVKSLTSPVTISLTGSIQGSVEFDGSSNVEIQTSFTDENLFTFTKSLLISTEWKDVGIQGNDLETGSYYMQVYVNNISEGGKSIDEYHTGILSWYSSQITGPILLETDEIPLHRAGASKEGILFLRTVRSEKYGSIKLQILASYNSINNSNYVFKFRKII